MNPAMVMGFCVGVMTGVFLVAIGVFVSGEVQQYRHRRSLKRQIWEAWDELDRALSGE